eukprot:225101-Chlamydomonas_euryale.AAC.3
MPYAALLDRLCAACLPPTDSHTPCQLPPSHRLPRPPPPSHRLPRPPPPSHRLPRQLPRRCTSQAPLEHFPRTPQLSSTPHPLPMYAAPQRSSA